MTSEVAGTPGMVADVEPGLTFKGSRIVLDPHHCFACGELNEHGMHLELHTQAGRCWTDVTLERRFQGWDGIAHGGIVTTILDEVMAWALIDQDAWGVTARIELAFKRPVPLEVPLRGEGWVVEARRRVMKTAGHLIDPATGTILATAAAIYVAASDEQREALRARYSFRVVDGSGRPATGTAG